MILFPNVNMAVCDWIRDNLPSGEKWSGALVTPTWSDQELAKVDWAVVVRNDGGQDSSVISQNVSLGVTCMGPRCDTEDDEIACERLAQTVAAIIRDCARPGDVNPFAGCTDMNGPYPIPSENGRPAYYLTADVEVVATVS